MTTTAELGLPTVTVSPGGEVATTLTVRNDSDIVEGYSLEVVGDCAAWSTVAPARISLYPGTTETVTVMLTPPRSPEVRAGDVPLGVRVLPSERPDSVVVPETTVRIEPFWHLRAELEPQRRRGWLGARFSTALRNAGNAPVAVALAGGQPGEELRFGFTLSAPRLEPGESAAVRLKLRHRRPLWFGKPQTWPFTVDVSQSGEHPPRPDQQVSPAPLDGEFIQLALLPKWLLAVLAALIALLLAWFALVRPTVRSTAKQAANDVAQRNAGGTGATKQPGGASAGGGQPADGATGGGASAGAGASGGQAKPGVGPAGGPGQQSSATIDVQTAGGARKNGVYRVPKEKVFQITDLVVANYQGDEGLLTITFGNRTITTIALETFRNQDYHWVTPIEVPADATVVADVTCAKPGTPASGRQASGCAEVLNVSGVLQDVRPAT